MILILPIEMDYHIGDINTYIIGKFLAYTCNVDTKGPKIER